MHAKIEDFKTGFFGIEIFADQREIDELIKVLEKLKGDVNYHFHLRGDYSRDSGIGDVMIARKGDEPNNLELER